MLTSSSPINTPDNSRQGTRYEPIIATPQTSQAVNKSHRLLRPIKSKLVSIQNFLESNPSLTRVETIWSPQVWPPTTRTNAKSYGGRRKRSRSGNNVVEDDQQKSVVEAAEFSEEHALKYARTTANGSLAKMYDNLYVSYRTFLRQIKSGCAMCSLAEIATYTLGTWTYLYEKQSSANMATPSQQPVLTLDDVLLEYLPPTHPHHSLLLGYTIALFNDYGTSIRPMLPSLILLTYEYSRRATLELLHVLFSVAGSGWEDFLLCMVLSRLIGYEDEYLKWLTQHMTLAYVLEGGLGHVLRVCKDYSSAAPVVIRGIQLAIPASSKPASPDLDPILSDFVQLICTRSLESQSTLYLRQLVSVLPAKHTPLPSLSLLVHLTLKSLNPSHPNTAFQTLQKRVLDYSPLRQTIPASALKPLIITLLADPNTSSLAIAVTRDWKEHIDYDEEIDDHFESTAEFLDRIERDYLTATEGVKWRFEDVLAEWVGEWPDGRELGTSKIPRIRNVVVEEPFSEITEEPGEEEWGGSIVKRDVVRSGLLMETPVPKDGRGDEKSVVLGRLFRLAGLGSSVRRKRHIDVPDDDTSAPFMQRLGREKSLTSLRKGPSAQRKSSADNQPSKGNSYMTEISDEDLGFPGDDLSSSTTRKRRRRRFGDNDSETDESVYEEHDIENQSVHDDLDMYSELPTSDVDELSISYEPQQSSHKCTNRRPRRSSSRHSLASITNKMLVRESSPIILEDPSDDELAI